MDEEQDPRVPASWEEKLERPLTQEERERLLATLEAQRDSRPVQPEPGWRAALRRAWAFVLGGIGVLAKFGAVIFKAKFLFSIFITLGLYVLFWGWAFGVAIFVLILIHELGHLLEARRQGLKPSAPQFRAIMAYVVHKRAASAYDGAIVALAGPALGAVGAAAAWGIGAHWDSNLFRAIAYFGFFLNLFNLLPFWILDGARIVDVVNPLILLVGVVGLAALAWRSHNFLLTVVLVVVAFSLWGRFRRRGAHAGDPYYHVRDWQPAVVTALYGGLIALLILGMVATEVPRPQ